MSTETRTHTSDFSDRWAHRLTRRAIEAGFTVAYAEDDGADVYTYTNGLSGSWMIVRIAPGFKGSRDFRAIRVSSADKGTKPLPIGRAFSWISAWGRISVY